MKPEDWEIWKRVVEQRREDCASLDPGSVQNVQDELDTLLKGFDGDHLAEKIEIAMMSFYAVASDEDRTPKVRRKALEAIQIIRKKLDEAMIGRTETTASTPKPATGSGESNQDKPLSTSTTETLLAAASNLSAKKTAGSSTRTTAEAASQSNPKSSNAKAPAAPAPAPSKLSPSHKNVAKPSNQLSTMAPGKSTSAKGTWTAHASARKQSLTASLAAASASTAEEAASAALDIFPERETNTSENSRQAPRAVNGDFIPPPYQRTSTTVAEDKAKKAAKKTANTSSLSSKNGARPVPFQPSNKPVIASDPTKKTPDVPVGSTSGKRALDSSDDMDISEGEEGSEATNQQSKAIKREEAHSKPAHSSFTLDTKTITSASFEHLDFPADFKRTPKRFTSYSSSQKERPPARVSFQKQSPGVDMLRDAARLFAIWEPYWRVEKVMATGVTSPIKNLVWRNSQTKNPMAPQTAGLFDFVPNDKLTAKESSKLSWGTAKGLLSTLRPKEGDYALLLRMLPVQVDPQYKKSRASCHVWPKGTLLTIDGTPIMIHQRKQASHDCDKWEYNCHPIDLARHMDAPTGKQSHLVAMCCYEQSQYFFSLALCSFQSPATLTGQLLSPGNSLLERLSLEKSIEKAMKYIYQQSVSIDDDNDGPSEGKNVVGKLIFSVRDPVSKMLMKVPVRGRDCWHFQVRGSFAGGDF